MYSINSLLSPAHQLSFAVQYSWIYSCLFWRVSQNLVLNDESSDLYMYSTTVHSYSSGPLFCFFLGLFLLHSSREAMHLFFRCSLLLLFVVPSFLPHTHFKWLTRRFDILVHCMSSYSYSLPHFPISHEYCSLYADFVQMTKFLLE